MNIESVDPRDGTWEQDSAVYRVYLWDRNEIQSHEYEVTDASVEEVLAWARDRAKEPGWDYTLYVRVDDSAGRRGLVRLDGVLGDPFPQP